ncbi:cell division protein FtsZ [Mycoplasma enhydrae]|uniref:cell division protein FtsZ n=1 Tax=Mycoplasma enhydrae TaxID=2499220 RepID=UPI00197C1655|nr:cell division protein FtsZ [Mycoplasma enhydrae]MBN4089182.1 cell division protein FtsZ [Mycoplasma enhydrae]MCV3733846.1 cell division protein FtsZ [Mycoplasma enhydrae]MCV3753722.1 cell division protein FtsZ [Mycoplasma enhydrae]
MSHNDNYNSVANIKVIGVGGGGNNSIKTLLEKNIDGLEFIVANTDKQILDKFDPSFTLALGDKRGIGAGANPEVGKKAAEHSLQEIKEKLDGANLVVITAGMGGGTGTGASPVIAKAAKEKNALVIAIVTTPFSFEGNKRKKIALEGIEELKKHVDSYIILSNDKLLEAYGDSSINDAFKVSDNVVKQFIRTIVDIIAIPGRINLDLADLETVIKNCGETLVGIGSANGENAASKALKSAISSPIMESNIVGASNAILYFSASAKTTLNDFNKAVSEFNELAGNDVNVIFGVTDIPNEDSEKLGEVYVSVIATGIKKQPKTDFNMDNIETNNTEATQEFLTLSASRNSNSYLKENEYNSDDNDLIFKTDRK